MRPSAWLPLATVVVFQANDADVAPVVVEKTCVPSTAEAIGVGRGAAAGGEADGDGAGDRGAGGGLVNDAASGGGGEPFCTVTRAGGRGRAARPSR